MFQVFLQHLSPLLSLPTFAALWLTILDFMDKYMHSGSSDLLVGALLLPPLPSAPLAWCHGTSLQ